MYPHRSTNHQRVNNMGPASRNKGMIKIKANHSLSPVSGISLFVKVFRSLNANGRYLMIRNTPIRKIVNNVVRITKK
jgi:hypothetical protein